MKAILGDGSIPDHALEELIGGVGLKAERAFEYARTTYTHGLPSGQFKTATAGQAEAVAVLSTLEGVAVLPLYCHYGPPNKLHIGWLKAIADHGYNPATNQLANLTATIGKTVYLHDMTVVVPTSNVATYRAGALTQWGPPATAGYAPDRKYQSYTGNFRPQTPIETSTSATEAYVRVDYMYVLTPAMPDTAEELAGGSFNISLSAYDNNADYFHVKYTAAGVTKYWMYLDDSGVYPTLDNVFFSEQQTNGTFFPFLYFRYNAVSEVSNTTTPAYHTSKKLAKYYGMDYDAVSNGINTNPDIADVQQAMMIMAVPANTSDDLENRYLFSFFDNIFSADESQFKTLIEAGISFGSSKDLLKTSLVIQDGRFKMAMTHSGIYKKRVVGSIGPIGKHTSGNSYITVPTNFIHAETGADYVYDTVQKYHYYRRQVSNTMYDEIQIFDLQVLYLIYGEYFSTGDETDAILLIPLDHSITEDFSVREREHLYSRAMHFVFNSMQIIKIKWYQQDWFSAFVKIVGLVLTVISLGSATGPWAALMSAIGTGSTALITAALMVLLEHLLIGLLIGAVLKVFVKAIGVDAAILLAVVATVSGFISAYDAGSITGAPWAQDLLMVGNGLTTGINAELKDMYGELIEEFNSFNIFKDKATKELEAANKLLEHQNWLSPFVIFGEKPDDYYNRTIHSGNIGVLGIGAISSYVDIALTLPKLDETIEG